MEICYLRGAYSVNTMDGESNNSVVKRFAISSRGEGMSNGVVEIT